MIHKFRNTIIQSLKLLVNKHRILRKLVVTKSIKIQMLYFHKYCRATKYISRTMRAQKRSLGEMKPSSQKKHLTEGEASEFSRLMNGIRLSLTRYQMYLFFMKLKYYSDSSQMYRTVTEYETVIPDTERPPPKTSQPYSQTTKFSPNYLKDYQSIVPNHEDHSVLFRGEIRIPQFESTPLLHKLR